MIRKLLLLATTGLLWTGADAADPWPIITRRGDQLFEGERPFRFFGLAAPNLQAHESQLWPDYRNRFPDDYETRDLLGSLQRLGARATRSFSLSVYSPDDGGVPFYVTGRRTYNEEAFRCLDLVLARCREYDVRVILPFIASQRFATVRGVDEFAALSGRGPGAFWTDEEVKADFRHFLAFVLNRRNTVSGVLYKDDPAILAWQLGNEFGSYAPDRKLDPAVWTPRITAWSLEMAAYIKSIDRQHLVMEAGGDRAAHLASPDIDVISTHLYEYWNRLFGGPTDLAAAARADRAACRGKKPLMVDEFGLASIGNIRALMTTIREEGIVGGLLWSIRCHRRDGGFMHHNEGGTPVNSYHYPGFGAGEDNQETLLFDLIRREAHAIDGRPVPPLAAPSPDPVLFRVRDGFTWRGSTGANHYTIERADGPAGPWEVRATGLHDSTVARAKELEESGDPTPVILWRDELAAPGRSYWYRVRGFNPAGATGYSAPVLVAPATN